MEPSLNAPTPVVAEVLFNSGEQTGCLIHNWQSTFSHLIKLMALEIILS